MTKKRQDGVEEEADNSQVGENRFLPQLQQTIELNVSSLVTHLKAARETYSACTTTSTQKACLHRLTNILSSQDVFYENMFVFLTAFSILKLDSFLKDQVMVKFINLLMQIADECSKVQKVSVEDKGLVKDCASEFAVVIDKLYRMVSWVVG